jgi:hypothetical protein
VLYGLMGREVPGSDAKSLGRPATWLGARPPIQLKLAGTAVAAVRFRSLCKCRVTGGLAENDVRGQIRLSSPYFSHTTALLTVV